MSKIKTYVSRYTVPHFSVGMKRIAFHATTNGRAYYITDDEELQKGIERHPWFKSKFFLESTEEASPQPSPVEREKGYDKKELVEMDNKLTNRSVNEGFSGGEKKRNEIFQMAMLEPRLAILDETDSGLDIDALRIVASGVNKLKRPDNASIVITHYQRLLDYIVPDFVHVLYDGRIVKTGGKELALELEEKGYDWLKG